MPSSLTARRTPKSDRISAIPVVRGDARRSGDCRSFDRLLVPCINNGNLSNSSTNSTLRNGPISTRHQSRFGRGRRWASAPEWTSLLLWKMIARHAGVSAAGARSRPMGCSARMFPPPFRHAYAARLEFALYLRSFSVRCHLALVSADDPLPGLMILPIFAFKHIYRMTRACAKSGRPR